MKIVVYEIWTRAVLVEAASCEEALDRHEPTTEPAKIGLNLSNWHAVPVIPDTPELPESISGGLNYRQVR